MDRRLTEGPQVKRTSCLIFQFELTQNRKLCEEEGVEPLQWSWIAKDASMTQSEIEPVRVSAQLKGQISSWVSLICR
jgi:hypothetical protein